MALSRFVVQHIEEYTGLFKNTPVIASTVALWLLLYVMACFYTAMALKETNEKLVERLIHGRFDAQRKNRDIGEEQGLEFDKIFLRGDQGLGAGLTGEFAQFLEVPL